MKKSILIIILTIIFSVSAIKNRYGMNIISNSGSYKLEDSTNICNTIDCATLPTNAYQPYTYKENLIKSYEYSYCKTTTYVYKNYGSYSLSMEVDIPALSKGPYPFIVYVHGGSWYSGSTASLKYQSQYMASHGVAGIRITYTLVDKGGRFDLGMQELDEAFVFIAAHATEWNLDMSRFGYLGNSAGVPLAALKAMKQPGCKLLVGYNGLYDFRNNLNGSFPAEGNKYLDNYLNIADRGPISAIEYIPSTNIPAVAVFHGTADFTISSKQSQVFADSIQHKGGRAECYIYNNYVHGFFNKGSSDVYEDILIKTYNFVKSVFNLPVVEFPNQEVSSVYYVSPDGDDLTNSGATVASPFQTIKKVFDIEALAGAKGNSEFTIYLKSGTYATTLITPNLNHPAKVNIIGASASTTIIEKASSSDFRFFLLQPIENAGLELNIKDITMQNFGPEKNYAGAIIMMNGSGTNIKVGFTRCAFKNNVACRGAILQSSQPSYEVSFNDCYFEQCRSFDYGGAATNLEAPIYVTAGKLSVKNCIFNNNTKDPLFGTTDRDLKKGSTVTINPVNGRIMAIFANNTFINNKADDGKNQAVSIQPAITVADLSVPKKGFGVDLIMVNNLFVNNKRRGFENDVDIYIDPTDVTLVTVSNNIFNKIATKDQSAYISAINNSISPEYSFTSSAIAFEMEVDLPKVGVADNGMPFVIAKGTDVVGNGISEENEGEVPETDIRGITRKSNPDIGATDVEYTSSLKETISGSEFIINEKNGYLSIINNQQHNFIVRIRDLTGRLIYTSNNPTQNFYTKLYLHGFHLITLQDDMHNTFTRKIIL